MLDDYRMTGLSHIEAYISFGRVTILFCTAPKVGYLRPDFYTLDEAKQFCKANYPSLPIII